MIAFMVEALVLRVQSAIDRLARRFRAGSPGETPRRRLLIIQIDGLPGAVFEEACSRGAVPFMSRLLRGGAYDTRPMTVGLPTSTPAFQLAAMYGVRPDIPGFHYHDKRRRRDVHFPRAGHAAGVERDQARGRVGILTGGSVYGCVFTGGAANDTLTFARLKQPTAPGLLKLGSAFLVLGWVILKGTALTLQEVGRTLGDLACHPRARQKVWQWAAIRIGFSVWIRELFTLAVSRDLYAAVPAIYVNFLDYDVTAHAFGPRSQRAFRSLNRVDRAIRQICRVARRLPEHRYDVFILSDHGQVACRPYGEISGGRPLERALFDEGLVTPGRRGMAVSASRGLGHGYLAYGVGRRRLLGRILRPLDDADHLRGPAADGAQDLPEAYERDGIRIISAGPNAFLYVTTTETALTADELEARWPGLAQELSTHRGVGFVLARSAHGPICFWRGKRLALDEDPGPFADRPDCAIVLRGIADLMNMPSAGDLVLYGTGAPEGDVSFITEAGAHAGPAPEELHTFLIHPAAVDVPDVDHPVQLYDLFIRYQTTAAAGSASAALSAGLPPSTAYSG